eukprot:PhF_6_TR20105/c0_g1_i1/m.29255
MVAVCSRSHNNQLGSPLGNIEIHTTTNQSCVVSNDSPIKKLLNVKRVQVRIGDIEVHTSSIPFNSYVRFPNERCKMQKEKLSVLYVDTTSMLPCSVPKDSTSRMYLGHDLCTHQLRHSQYTH